MNTTTLGQHHPEVGETTRRTLSRIRGVRPSSRQARGQTAGEGFSLMRARRTLSLIRGVRPSIRQARGKMAVEGVVLMPGGPVTRTRNHLKRAREGEVEAIFHLTTTVVAQIDIVV